MHVCIYARRYVCMSVCIFVFIYVVVPVGMDELIFIYVIHVMLKGHTYQRKDWRTKFILQYMYFLINGRCLRRYILTLLE